MKVPTEVASAVLASLGLGGLMTEGEDHPISASLIGAGLGAGASQLATRLPPVSKALGRRFEKTPAGDIEAMKAAVERRPDVAKRRQEIASLESKIANIDKDLVERANLKGNLQGELGPVDPKRFKKDGKKIGTWDKEIIDLNNAKKARSAQLKAAKEKNDPFFKGLEEGIQSAHKTASDAYKKKMTNRLAAATGLTGMGVGSYLGYQDPLM